MPLTDTTIKNAKPAEKPYKLSDEKGMYLFVTPAGGKLWRMQYRYAGKQKLLAFGKYPEISLRDARERRDEARKLLANGADPGAVKKAQKAAGQERAGNSFEITAREWYEDWKRGRTESTGERVLAMLKRDVFPWLGGRPVAEITAPEILVVLRRIAGRGAVETAHRAGRVIGQAIRYAIATGRAKYNPVPDLKGALPPAQGGHFAALLDPARVGQLLRDIDSYSGRPEVVAALKFIPLVFVRPSELRNAKWADIDLDAGEWAFTVSKTKVEHLVPLSRQAVQILRELQPITGDNRHGLVFPGLVPGKPISSNTTNAALRRMGYSTSEEHTTHGFRATARTLLAEKLRVTPDWIEAQLSHAVPDRLGTAYNRTKFLEDRRAMMQTWADYLDRLKNGADVIPIRPAA